MSKVRVYELAKKYGMKGPEMAELLRDLGFDKVKSHMAALDGPDQLMVEARLEAQGLVAKEGSGGGGAPTKTGGPPRKKSLPKKKGDDDGVPAKKALPTKRPEPEPLRTAVPGTDAGSATPTTAATPEVEAEPAAREPAPAPSEPAAPAAEPARVEPEPTTAAPEPVASEPTPTPPREEPATPPAVAAPAAQSAEPVAQEPTPPAPTVKESGDGTATEREPEPAEQAPAAETTADPAQPAVKRLLVPQAKAQVVGRIELPQETIRDATRRSAPASARDADRKLRSRALQSTQSRTAARGSGARRGPGPGGRRGGRDGGRQRRQKTGAPVPTVDPNKVVEIQPPVSVKALSEGLGIKVPELLATLAFKLGVAGKTINSFLSNDEVELVALELERKINVVEQREAEEELLQSIVEEAAEEDEVQRAPVVTFMGHVDHGKTTLLDALRDSDITKGEAGGITQHIGAYKVTHKSGQQFVVLDTPGHAAFTAMRARGAKLTDIVVLVVAADDGVMPQTEEAISHALEADVVVIVAVTKCDRPNANPMQVRQQLAVKGLQPEEWGGKHGVVDVSATEGTGLDDLVERIALEAEQLELSAQPSAAGAGVVVESKQTPEQGVVVNVLVTNGTLRVKDRALVGESLSRVRGMTDDHGRQVTEAGPSTPVTLLGIDDLPTPGDQLFVITDPRKAKEVVEDRQRRARDMSLAERSTVTLETLSEHLADRQVEEVKIIVKADVMGSLEPIKQVLADLGTDEVRVNIIHAALGGISETDVKLAEASNAILIGFNSVADTSARQEADRAGVEIRFYDVIYNLIDDMRLALEGLLAPDAVEKVTGHAEIRAIFRSSKFGNIAGCYVLDGVITRNSKVRVSREGNVVWTGDIAGLRRVKDDVREVKANFECGITFSAFNDIKVGDQIEAFSVEYVKRTLEE